MDDEVASPVWQLDPDTRSQLRIERVRTAAGQGDWPAVVVEAEELLDESPDHGEALGLLATGLLELGDAENAVEAFEEHLHHTDGDAGSRAAMLSGLAVARFEACDVVGAVSAAREAVRLDPGLAEAHYTLGLALERTPDGRGEAATAFAAARSLDPEGYPWPIKLSDADLKGAYRRALQGAHPRIASFWRGVPVELEDEPDLVELRASPPPLPPTVAGLYRGVPPADAEDADGAGLLAARPEALRLYRRNLARCRSLDEVVEQVAAVLEQEALDWLGLSLDELAALP